ncbi:zinc finger protein 6 [Phtheirospermum japonicum]|uniref:Zinc finger protein 6 n=1 Tax=Phtheirospermum japonicum TaxID=374723 RepID=A0A830BKP3_9LAMI|nr:zinc finger protein 6 [Phtheirospermum japonicum]
MQHHHALKTLRLRRHGGSRRGYCRLSQDAVVLAGLRRSHGRRRAPIRVPVLLPRLRELAGTRRPSERAQEGAATAQARANAGQPERRRFVRAQPYDLRLRAAGPPPRAGRLRLVPGVGGGGASPPWVCVPRAAQPIHVAHGCVFPALNSGRGAGSVSYAGGVGESSFVSVGAQQPVKAHSGRLDGPSLSRFTRLDDGPGFEDAFGLDLQLSL